MEVAVKEGRYEYMCVFDSSALESMIMGTKESLEKAGLIVKAEIPASPTVSKPCRLLITASRRSFELEAERRGLLKQKQKPDPLTGAPRNELFVSEDRNTFAEVESEDFFLSCERVQMIVSMLEHVDVMPSFLPEEKCDGQTCKDSSTSRGLDRLSSSKWFQALKSTGPEQRQQDLLQTLQTKGFVTVLAPLHELELVAKCFKETMWGSEWENYFDKLFTTPVDHIREYFGSEVAYYFCWMNFFTWWLIIPGIGGVLCYLYGRDSGVTVDRNPLNPVFTFGMMFWAFLFLAFWKRQATAKACEWDTLDLLKKEDIRRGYHGPLVESPVTGLHEVQYPSWKRYFIHYPVSVMVTFFMLCIAFMVMSCSLNLQGYVHGPEEDEISGWTGKKKFASPIHVPFLARLAEEGAIFDPNADFWYPSLIPVIGAVLVIQQLNGLYRRIAEQLTEWENHRTEHEHLQSLIMKRFFFEAFDCYIALFYIAFWELDVDKLRGELVSLYTADSFRRVLTESVLPSLAQWWALRGEKKNAADALAKSKKTDQPTPEGEEAMVALPEHMKDEYEGFDDYLEMIIEFGYITMFASAFPLAAGFSIICNLIEVRSDMFKLARTLRRPEARRDNNIGPWLKILTGMCWLCIITNIWMMALTSEQLMVWFPQMFKVHVDATDGDHEHSIKKSGLWLMMGLEHLFIVVGLVITFVISNTPEWVKNDTRRRQYEQEQAMLRERKRKRKQLLQ